MPPYPEGTLFHITTAAAWQAARASGEYRAASLEREGFIHLSTGTQWRATLARFFRGQRGLVLLAIRPSALRAPVRFEPADGELFPHLYGPLDVDAVIDALPISVPEA